MKCVIKVILWNIERLCGSQVCIKCDKTSSIVTYREWKNWFSKYSNMHRKREKKDFAKKMDETSCSVTWTWSWCECEKRFFSGKACTKHHMQIKGIMKLMLMWSMREKIYSKYEIYKTSSAITCKKWEKCFLKKCERVWSTVSWTEYIEKWIEQDQNIISASGVKMKCITKVILWNTQRLCWSNSITVQNLYAKFWPI